MFTHLRYGQGPMREGRVLWLRSTGQMLVFLKSWVKVPWHCWGRGSCPVSTLPAGCVGRPASPQGQPRSPCLSCFPLWEGRPPGRFPEEPAPPWPPTQACRATHAVGVQQAQGANRNLTPLGFPASPSAPERRQLAEVTEPICGESGSRKSEDRRRGC